MRVVLSLVVGCLAAGFAAAPQASAQYPIYVPQSYGQMGYPHGHHSHHCSPQQTQYYSGYGYAPSAGYSPLYGGGLNYAQPVAPPSSIYYSNNYYGAPSAYLPHAWHPGHYLLGN